MSVPKFERQRHRFEMHVQHTRQRAYNLAYRLLGNASDAEDVTQDAYVRAWQHFDRFDFNRAFESWLFRIVTNRAIDLLRRRKRFPMYSLDALAPEEADGQRAAPYFAAPDSNPEQIVLAPIQEEPVARAFAALSLPYQQALLFATLEELSYKEIALRLDCPVGTIRSRVHRARGRLRSGLQKTIA